MTDSITRLAAPPPPAPITTDGVTEDLLHPNWDLPIPRLRNQDDVLAYGRHLLQPKATTGKANKGKGRESEADEHPDVVDVEAELGSTLEVIKYQAAQMHQVSHRMRQFLKSSDDFIGIRLADSYLALSQQSYYSATSQRLGSGDGPCEEYNSSMAELPGVAHKGSRCDARDLLRGISRGEVSRDRWRPGSVAPFICSLAPLVR